MTPRLPRSYTDRHPTDHRRRVFVGALLIVATVMFVSAAQFFGWVK
jgi:hypothetical protein